MIGPSLNQVISGDPSSICEGTRTVAMRIEVLVVAFEAG